MDRREVLKGAALLAITQIGGAPGGEAAQSGRPIVLNLDPADSIPENYYSTSKRHGGFGHACGGCRGCAGFDQPGSPESYVEYESYSLFLISNLDWLKPDSSDRISSLYRTYEAFSRAIGDRHAAIFFWIKTPKRVDGKIIADDLAADLDTGRCADYAKLFNLSISESPHVVVTRKRPTLGSPVTDFTVLSLNGISSESTTKLLTLLADELVRNKLSKAALDSEKFWLKFQDAIISVYRGVGKAIGKAKAKIHVGPLEVEVETGT